MRKSDSDLYARRMWGIKELLWKERFMKQVMELATVEAYRLYSVPCDLDSSPIEAAKFEWERLKTANKGETNNYG